MVGMFNIFLVAKLTDGQMDGCWLTKLSQCLLLYTMGMLCCQDLLFLASPYPKSHVTVEGDARVEMASPLHAYQLL